MANPGKYVFQAVLAGAGLIGRAFLQSYRRVAGEGAKAQAEKAAAGAAVQQNSAFNARRRMRLDEAKKILHVEKEHEALPPEELARMINKSYEKLYTDNALPNGSFYLQSKIFRAKEAMEHEFRKSHGFSLLSERAKEGAAAAGAGTGAGAAVEEAMANAKAEGKQAQA